MIEQRTMEWHKQRCGKITASEFAVLMKNNRKKEPFSDATYSYLDKKVMERYIPDVGGNLEEYIETRNVFNKAMQYGTDMEPFARTAYSELMGYEVLEVEFIPLKGYEKYCGVSADGIARIDKRTNAPLNGGVEIKCPYTVESHLDHLMLQTPQDLIDLKPEYAYQCYLNMIAWEADWWDFFSYCPYVSRSKQSKVLRLHKDDKIFAEIFKRLDLAVEYMKNRIDTINNISNIIL